MKKCSSSFDRLSELPSNITESILLFLPMRDMVRTSVLSKKWRFRWVQVPELIFEDDSKMFQSPEEDRNNDNLNIVVGILFQHHGPIKKFKLDVSSWNSCYGIDKIFQFLSRNGVQDLNLIMPRTKFRLPSSIYSCRELKHLSLKSCLLQPLTLVGFSKLVSLELLNVKLDTHATISGCPFLQCLIVAPLIVVTTLTIDCPNLTSIVIKWCVLFVLINKAPLLKVLSLLSAYNVYMEKKGKLMEFLTSFPLLENLSLSDYCVQSIARDSPNELPTTLEKIRMLRLNNIDLYKKDQLSSVLRLIRSSPNLQKLEITEHNQANLSQRQQSLPMLNSCNYCLVKLREVKFELTTDPRGCLEFCKFILAVSPELETLYIKPASLDIDLSCYKTLLKLASTRRASPKADVVFIGLDLDN